MVNPYLQSQGDELARQYNNNFQQSVLPSINGGAMMAGGFGGSRQGVAQGIAAGQSQQALGGALANLYGNAYDQDQNRANQAAMQQAQIASNERINNANLGLGYTQAGNSFALGLGNLGLGNRQADQNYSLGLGGLANAAQANANQYSLGQQQNANTAQANQNQYNLGLGQLGLGQYTAETNRGLGYGQLAQQGEQNAFANQQAGFNSQLAALNALQGWNTNGINWANQQQQTPLQNLGQLTSIGQSIGGQGASQTTPGYSALQGALSGGLTMAQIIKLLGG